MTAPSYAAALSALQHTLRTARGISISYHDPPAAPLTLTAIPGRTEHDIETAEGTYTTWESRDWIVLASDLPAAPNRAAIITETDPDGTERRYQITMPGNGRHWRWTDSRRTAYRIFSKQIIP